MCVCVRHSLAEIDKPEECVVKGRAYQIISQGRFASVVLCRFERVEILLTFAKQMQAVEQRGTREIESELQKKKELRNT